MSKDYQNSMRDDNVDNQDNINDSEMMELGEIKTKTFQQLKNDNMYILNNMNIFFQDKLLWKVLDDDKKDDENIEKVLLLINELQKMNI